MPQGVTVKELLAYFAPEAVHIRRPDGTDVTSGNLATGMTAGEYTIAVLGDCDGSGTLSQADLRQAQALLLEDSSTQGASRRAGTWTGTASSPPRTWCSSASGWSRKEEGGKSIIPPCNQAACMLL